MDAILLPGCRLSGSLFVAYDAFLEFSWRPKGVWTFPLITLVTGAVVRRSLNENTRINTIIASVFSRRRYGVFDALFEFERKY